jgi:tripartite-type tricarboxylate transporter receptor subunit TctC
VVMPDVVERLKKFDITPESMQPAEYRKLIGEEIDLWTKVAKDNNLQVEQ